jgi:hypothetical protein
MSLDCDHRFELYDVKVSLHEAAEAAGRKALATIKFARAKLVRLLGCDMVAARAGCALIL